MPKPNASSTKKPINVGGRPGRWTDEQIHIIESIHLRQWHKFAVEENKDLPAHTRQKRLTRWKQDEAELILQKPEFSILQDNMSYSDAREALVRKFTNYHNNLKRSTGLGNPSAEIITAMKAAASALVDMKTFAKGRDLFRKRMEPEIMARRAEILDETPGLSSIVAFQTALKELWDHTDQSVWEEKAVVNSEDIYQNQIHFPSHLHSSMTGLCRAGGVGPLELLTFYAYRDEAGCVLSGILEAHHSDHVPSFLASSEGIDREKLSLCFQKWALGVLPEAASSTPSAGQSEHRIPRNASGVPVFPLLDLGYEGPEIVRQVIKSYLTHLWNYCRPTDSSSIPWEKVRSEPDYFYNTQVHEIQHLLDEPASLSINSAYALAAKFSAHSNIESPDPFQFHNLNRAECASGSSLPLDQLLRISTPTSPPTSPTPKSPSLDDLNRLRRSPSVPSLIIPTPESAPNLSLTPKSPNHPCSAEAPATAPLAEEISMIGYAPPDVTQPPTGTTHPNRPSPPSNVHHLLAAPLNNSDICNGDGESSSVRYMADESPLSSPPSTARSSPPPAEGIQRTQTSDSLIACQSSNDDQGRDGTVAKPGSPPARRSSNRHTTTSNVVSDAATIIRSSNRGRKEVVNPSKKVLRGRKRRIDEVVLTDGRQGKLRRTKNWEGGYFSAHGDADEKEEWKDEKDIAVNCGALEAEQSNNRVWVKRISVEHRLLS